MYVCCCVFFLLQSHPHSFCGSMAQWPRTTSTTASLVRKMAYRIQPCTTVILFTPTSSSGRCNLHMHRQRPGEQRTGQDHWFLPWPLSGACAWRIHHNLYLWRVSMHRHETRNYHRAPSRLRRWRWRSRWQRVKSASTAAAFLCIHMYVCMYVYIHLCICVYVHECLLQCTCIWLIYLSGKLETCIPHTPRAMPISSQLTFLGLKELHATGHKQFNPLKTLSLL